jgi:hypothetical protein
MISFILKLVRTVTLSRVLMWVVATALALALYTVYENRGRISAAALSPRMSNPVGMTFNVGEESRLVIEAKVKGDPSVIGIAVLSADLRSNEARSVFFFGDDPLLNSVDRNARVAGTNSVPMFTSDELHNTTTIRLINGQFTCQKFQDMLISKIYPDLGTSVKAVCKASIPSYYGYFSGYLAMFLTSVPSTAQEEQLKVVVEKLATDIYFRDVLTTQHQNDSKPGVK